DRFAAAGVGLAFRSTVLPPGQVVIIPPGAVGFDVGGNPINDWLSTLLVERRSDVDKLNRGLGVSERHLFVWVGGSEALVSYGVMETLRAGAPLPPGAPDLPQGITHVWLASDAWADGR